MKARRGIMVHGNASEAVPNWPTPQVAAGKSEKKPKHHLRQTPKEPESAIYLPG